MLKIFKGLITVNSNPGHQFASSLICFSKGLDCVKYRYIKYCIFFHKDIVVFVTNTPVFDVKGVKQCNPQLISSAENLCCLFRFAQVYYSAINWQRRLSLEWERWAGWRTVTPKALFSSNLRSSNICIIQWIILFLQASHEIIYAFLLALLTRLVSLRRVERASPFIHFIQVAIPRYRLLYGYPLVSGTERYCMQPTGYMNLLTVSGSSGC